MCPIHVSRYDPTATQAQVYEDASSIIQSVTDGYNVCYLAYGSLDPGLMLTILVHRSALRHHTHAGDRLYLLPVRMGC